MESNALPSSLMQSINVPFVKAPGDVISEGSEPNHYKKSLSHIHNLTFQDNSSSLAHSPKNGTNTHNGGVVHDVVRQQC